MYKNSRLHKNRQCAGSFAQNVDCIPRVANAPKILGWTHIILKVRQATSVAVRPSQDAVNLSVEISRQVIGGDVFNILQGT